eukprot:CAMPEP_0185211700 /NCGR_PEP_ID=MMETSP1140-20130426/67154_1 /TAXON_ID=298111 /ORGANISM="Pavlova sp., Strain CCMP459" /LENGTH=187 /DNA_ID=CAMNT_0027779543 /DNA_START=422 /DNA_END=988 /DNA_ORIENTATION=-
MAARCYILSYLMAAHVKNDFTSPPAAFALLLFFFGISPSGDDKPLEEAHRLHKRDIASGVEERRWSAPPPPPHGECRRARRGVSAHPGSTRRVGVPVVCHVPVDGFVYEVDTSWLALEAFVVYHAAVEPAHDPKPARHGHLVGPGSKIRAHRAFRAFDRAAAVSVHAQWGPKFTGGPTLPEPPIQVQ